MEWRSIQGFEGYYEVSDEGCVRSVDRDLLCADGVTYHRKGHSMKLTLGASGYLVVNLRKYGKSNVKPVHKLVAWHLYLIQIIILLLIISMATKQITISQI